MLVGIDARDSRFVCSTRFASGVAAGAVLALIGVAFFGAELADARQPQHASVETLLSTSVTILGEPIAYPSGPVKITAAIVTLPAGASTGWHIHDVPLFGHMLEGELTVNYGAHGVRVYRAGDSFMEAMETAHDGHNGGDRDVRILAVYMGAEGLPLSRKVEAPSKQ